MTVLVLVLGVPPMLVFTLFLGAGKCQVPPGHYLCAKIISFSNLQDECCVPQIYDDACR